MRRFKLQANNRPGLRRTMQHEYVCRHACCGGYLEARNHHVHHNGLGKSVTRHTDTDCCESTTWGSLVDVPNWRETADDTCSQELSAHAKHHETNFTVTLRILTSGRCPDSRDSA